MVFLKRWGLFIITNLLIMVTFGIVSTFLASALKLNFLQPHLGSLMIFCLVFGMAGSFFSLWASKWLAKTMYRVKIIKLEKLDPELLAIANQETLRNIVMKVQFLAKKAGLTKSPEVGIYQSDDVNAFATGPSKNNALVAVSTGLLRSMSEEEVDGVLGHELSHVANGDMVTMTLIQGIVNSFAMFFSRILASIAANSVEEKNRGWVYMLCTIAGDIVFTLLGSMVVTYFSRIREFRADKGSAQITSKQNMIAALKKLQLISTRTQGFETEERTDSVAALKISSTGKKSGIRLLFSTHPSLDDRIAALQSARG